MWSKMKNFNQIEDKNLKNSLISHIEEQGARWDKIRSKTLDRINNYLFSLNAGALLASLTYVATKANSADIMLSICFFAIGIFFCLLHASIDYYSVELSITKYKQNVHSFYKNEIKWNDYLNKSLFYNKKLDLALHIIGWISGGSFVIALINGIAQLK